MLRCFDLYLSYRPQNLNIGSIWRGIQLCLNKYSILAFRQSCSEKAYPTKPLFEYCFHVFDRLIGVTQTYCDPSPKHTSCVLGFVWTNHPNQHHEVRFQRTCDRICPTNLRDLFEPTRTLKSVAKAYSLLHTCFFRKRTEMLTTIKMSAY